MLKWRNGYFLLYQEMSTTDLVVAASRLPVIRRAFGKHMKWDGMRENFPPLGPRVHFPGAAVSMSGFPLAHQPRKWCLCCLGRFVYIKWIVIWSRRWCASVHVRGNQELLPRMHGIPGTIRTSWGSRTDVWLPAKHKSRQVSCTGTRCFPFKKCLVVVIDVGRMHTHPQTSTEYYAYVCVLSISLFVIDRKIKYAY